MCDKRFDSILLASGGMDSTVLAYWLKKSGENTMPIFFDYGQHFKDTELQSLRKLLPSDYVSNLRVINLKDIYIGSKSRMIIEPNLWKDKVTADDMYLPYRNLLFMTVAVSVAQTNGITTVYSAFINSNHAKEIDCSKEFFDKLSSLLDVYGSVEIKMPFRFFTKKDVANMGLKLGVPIAETYSCQASSTIPCGVCPNCVDRLNALESYFKKGEF